MIPKPILELKNAKITEGVLVKKTLKDLYDEEAVVILDKDDGKQRDKRYKGYLYGDYSVPDRCKDGNYLKGKTQVAFDIDKIPKGYPDQFPLIVNCFKEYGISCHIYTSWSHDPKNGIQKYRIIVEIDRETIPVEHYTGFYFYIRDTIDILKDNPEWLDTKAESPTQFFYAKSYHPDRKDDFREELVEADPFPFGDYLNSVDKKLKEAELKPIQGLQSDDDIEFPDTEKYRDILMDGLTYFSPDERIDVWQRVIHSWAYLYQQKEWDKQWLEDKLIEWSKKSKDPKDVWDDDGSDTVKQFHSLFNYQVNKMDIRWFRKQVRIRKKEHKENPKGNHINGQKQYENDAQLLQRILNEYFYIYNTGEQSLILKEDIRELSKKNSDDIIEYKSEKAQAKRLDRILYKLGHGMYPYKTRVDAINLFTTVHQDEKTGFGFYPNQDVPSKINLFPQEFATPIPKNPQPVDLEKECPEWYALCSRATGHYLPQVNWFLDILSHRVQKPQEKPQHCIVLLGRQGTGKGTLRRVLTGLFGKIVENITDITSVMGKHNEMLLTTYIAWLDEGGFKYTPEFWNRFKSYITEDTKVIQPKHKKAMSVESRELWIIATNDFYDLKIDKDDRRFAFFSMSDELRDASDEELERINKELDKELPKIMEHFATRDISKFNRFTAPPQSELFDKQKIVNLKGFQGLFLRMAEDGIYYRVQSPLGKLEFKETNYDLDKPQLIFSGDLEDAVNKHDEFKNKHQHYTKYDLKNAIEELGGFKKKKIKHYRTGKLRWAIYFPPLEEFRNLLKNKYRLNTYQFAESIESLRETREEEGEDDL